MKQESVKTTVSIDVATADKVAKYATRQQKTRSDVISAMADYFQKNGVDPFAAEPPTQAINRLAKRNEDLVKLFRGIERDSIRPLLVEAEKLVGENKETLNLMKRIATFINEKLTTNNNIIITYLQNIEKQNDSIKNGLCRLYAEKAVEKGKFDEEDYQKLFSNVR